MILIRKTANPGKHLEILGCQGDRETCMLNSLQWTGQLFTVQDCLVDVSSWTNWTSSQVLKARLTSWNIIWYLMGVTKDFIVSQGV